VFLVYYDSNNGAEFSIHSTLESARLYAEEWMTEVWGDEYTWEKIDESRTTYLAQWSDGGDEYMSIIEHNING
jgi:hypothetical protein